MIKLLSSARITVVCLFLLFILTFWGTVAQVEHGLYLAQERYFNSFFFLAASFIPFPGGQLVLWILFVNLICATFVRFMHYRRWTYIGILIIHFGLLLYLLSAFLVFHASKESRITLAEGQSTNVSISYFDWELAYWKETGHEPRISAIETKLFKPGYQVPFKTNEFVLTVNQYYTNADAYASASQQPATVNASGIGTLKPKPLVTEREQNVPGAEFDLVLNNKHYNLMLYGDEEVPTQITANGVVYNFILRRKRTPLPFSIQLDKFKAEFHPGTQTAKSFESDVTFSNQSLKRQVKIYMNNPLRFKDYTLFQASYSNDSKGRQYSTLAVVKNYARFLPYIACFVVFFGLALHFMIQALTSKAKR